MNFRLIPLFVSLLLPLTLGGCVAPLLGEVNLADNVILWHSWDEADAEVLDQILSQVTEISPGTTVISVHVPQEELLDRYINATLQGIGPDLLIGSSEWIRDLVETETIRSVDALDFDKPAYYENALSAVIYEARIFGFPLSLYPVALYYNSSQAPSPPASLEALLAQADAGNRIALVPRFRLSYWGIQTFGHGLFDDSGRFTLDGSGFTEWLVWLNDVQDDAGVILNTDDAAMEEMFTSGQVTYYVAGPDELTLIDEATATKYTRVSVLPSGPAGPSGPLLPVETVMLSTSSSSTQSEIALAVARYLTNAQQSTTLMRDLGRVPANRNVNVDPRVYPLLSGFSAQSVTAVSLPNALYREEFYEAGDRAYVNAVTGVLTPAESVCRFGHEVILIQDYAPEDVDMPADCEEE